MHQPMAGVLHLTLSEWGSTPAIAVSGVRVDRPKSG